ncbi:MAG: MMPL family transporter, partial [Deltaproteobacteria bacterium]|nr:MMPL family transporter [Deltaproteobacteria bacterium]
DLLMSSVLVLVLVGAALLFFYRRVRSIPLLVLPLFTGVSVTFALSRATIHYLNPNTAFLGSIIVGNGINAGIILLARYFEERRNGRPVQDSLTSALQTTWKGTLAASGGAAVSYGSLVFVAFRGFNQFGFMGFFGMLICWAATYAVMPALLALSERRWPFEKTQERGSKLFGGGFAGPLGRLVTTHPARVTVLTLALVGVSLIGVVRFARDPIEYDFTHLGSRSGLEQGAAKWDKHVDAVLQSYQTPTVVLTDSAAQADAVAEALRKAKDAPGSTIDSVRSLDELVPLDQDHKLATLRALFDELTPRVIAGLPDDLRPTVQKLKDRTQLTKVTLADVPEKLSILFKEKDGREGLMVMAYPTLAADAHHGRTQLHHSIEVREAALKAVPDARVAGQIVLTADIVTTITNDGRFAAALSFLGVALLTLLALRKPSHALWVIGSLCLGVLWMFGVLGLFDIKFNFVNFAVLPITFGIGVDYAVNYYARYRETHDAGAAVEGAGGAVALCSATTIIGYAVLLIADNQAIQSFGLTAVIGELTCLFAALVALPALLALRDRKARSTT